MNGRRGSSHCRRWLKYSKTSTQTPGRLAVNLEDAICCCLWTFPIRHFLWQFKKINLDYELQVVSFALHLHGTHHLMLLRLELDGRIKATAIFLSPSLPPKHYSRRVSPGFTVSQRQKPVSHGGFPEQAKGVDMESHLWFLANCAVILGHRRSIPHNSISSPATPGCWHHNPQIYFTKAAGEILIPNPCESIHFSPSLLCGAHRRAARPDKDGTLGAKKS